MGPLMVQRPAWRTRSPLGLAAAVFALLTCAWQQAAKSLPESPRSAEQAYRATLWSDSGGGPFYTSGDPHTAGTLFVGASRTGSIDPRVFESAGFGPTATVWGLGAQASDLLDVARNYPARRLVVCVSPITLYTDQGLVARIMKRRDAPNLAAKHTLEQLRALVRQVDEALHERGRTDVNGEQVVMAWFEGERLKRERQPTVSKRIERTIDDWANDLRADNVRTLRAESWESAWFPTLQPSGSNDEYRHWLRAETRGVRDESLTSLARTLGDFLKQGWEIVGLRLPLSEELFVLEDEALPRGRFVQLFEDLGVPYLDYSKRNDFLTSDGSHMTVESGRRLCRELSLDLATTTHWDRGAGE